MRYANPSVEQHDYAAEALEWQTSSSAVARRTLSLYSLCLNPQALVAPWQKRTFAAPLVELHTEAAEATI